MLEIAVFVMTDSSGNIALDHSNPIVAGQTILTHTGA